MRESHKAHARGQTSYRQTRTGRRRTRRHTRIFGEEFEWDPETAAPDGHVFLELEWWAIFCCLVVLCRNRYQKVRGK